MSTNTLIPQANPTNKCCRRASLPTGNVSELYIAGGPPKFMLFSSKSRRTSARGGTGTVCLPGVFGKTTRLGRIQDFPALMGAVPENVARLADGAARCKVVKKAGKSFAN